MFDVKTLIGLTPSECAGYEAEFRARLTELNDKHRLSRADESEAEDLLASLDQLDTHRERMQQKARFAGAGGRRQLEGKEFRVLPGSGGDEHGVRNGAGADERDVHGTDAHAADRGLRTAARRTLDQLVDTNRLPARSAEIVDRLTQVGPKSDRDWASRMVEAVGSDDYLRAFGRLMADPTRGHLMWSGRESEAFQRVQQLRSEIRAMSLTDTQGGFAVPLTIDPSIAISNSGSVNPLRAISKVVQTVTDSYRGLTSAGVSASFDAEAEEVSDDSPTLGEVVIPVHRAQAFVPASYEILADAVNLATEVGKLLNDGYQQLTNAHFTTGSGVGGPTGIVTAVAAASGSLVAPSVAESFTAADLFKVQNAAAPRWQANARWMMNLGFINSARQFESANGAIKFPELAGSPPMLLGRPVHENSGMDSALNPAASESNHVVLYGDFQQFCIVDRWPSTIELIPNLFGPNRRPTGQRGFYLFARTGSDVLVENAFRLLSIPTTA